MKRRALLSCLWAAAGCHTLPDDGIAVTAQRPTLSSDTATTAVRSFELEAGGTAFDGGSSAIPVSLKYGVTDSTEVFFGWLPYVVVDTTATEKRGPGDVTIGGRHRFYEEANGKTSFAVQSALKLPTADESADLGTGEVDFQIAGIGTQLVEEWTLTGFVQLDLLGDPAGGVLFGQSVAIAAAHPLPHRFGAFGEIAGVFVPEADAEVAFSTVGVTYNPHRYLVFDLSVAIGLTDEAPDFGISLGLTQNLGRPTSR